MLYPHLSYLTFRGGIPTWLLLSIFLFASSCAGEDAPPSEVGGPESAEVDRLRSTSAGSSMTDSNEPEERLGGDTLSGSPPPLPVPGSSGGSAQHSAPKPRAHEFVTEEDAAAFLKPERLLVLSADALATLDRRWMVVRGEEPSDSDARLYLVRESFKAGAKHGEIVAKGGWVLSQSVGAPWRTEFEQEIANREINRVTIRGNPGRQFETKFDGEEASVLFWNEPTSRPGLSVRCFMVSPPEAYDSQQVKVANQLYERS